MATVLAEWSVVVEVAVRGGRKKRGEAEGGRGERRFLIDSTMGRWAAGLVCIRREAQRNVKNTGTD